jgi:hypothetical protein
VIEREGLELLIQQIFHKQVDHADSDNLKQLQQATNYLKVLDTFNIPGFKYDVEDKTFVQLL